MDVSSGSKVKGVTVKVYKCRTGLSLRACYGTSTDTYTAGGVAKYYRLHGDFHDVAGAMARRDAQPFQTKHIKTWTGHIHAMSHANNGHASEKFGIVADGYIRITKGGAYTCHLNSDDGSYVDVKKAGRWQRWVTFDGLHGAAPHSKTGTTNLGAGWHHVRIHYFEKHVHHNLKVEISGGGHALAPMRFFRKTSGDDRIHGAVVKTIVAHGSYRSHLDPGNYVVVGSRPGFVGFREGISLAPFTETRLPVQLMQPIKAGQLTAVLSWGSRPSDLDLTATMAAAGGQPACTSNWEKRACTGMALNVDAIDSHGPETITITNVKHTLYTFKVTQHSNDGALLASGATVRVRCDVGEFQYRVGDAGHMSADSRTWTVFTLDGNTGEITASRSG